MFWRKKSYFDNSAPDIKNRRKQPCQVRYMAPIEQFFVTLNVATPDLFASLTNGKTDRKLRQAINPSAGMLRSGLITTNIRHTIGHGHMTAITETNEVVPCHLCNLTATQLKIRHRWNSLTVVWFWNGKQGFELKSGNKHDRPSNECQTTFSIVRQYVHTRAHYIPQHIHSMILTVNSNVMTMNFV